MNRSGAEFDSHELNARVLIAGHASGRILRLGTPLSFWGGVHPETGKIIDPRHPEHGKSVAGRILAVPATIGSSSSSAIMLELLRNRVAPAALLLGTVDAILVLGVVVARELGYPTIPVLELARDNLVRVPEGVDLTVAEDGRIVW